MNYNENIRRGIRVSPADEYLLHQQLWHTQPDGYVVIKVKGRTIYLHKRILTNDSEVDHINRNKLDNRRENLRYATSSQNKCNRALQSNNTSGYRGVYKMRTCWTAKIKLNGKQVVLGTFITKEEAALTYDIAAKKHYGEFAQLNFDLSI